MTFNDDKSDLSEAPPITETPFTKAAKSTASFKPANVIRNRATRKGRIGCGLYSRTVLE